MDAVIFAVPREPYLDVDLDQVGKEIHAGRLVLTRGLGVPPSCATDRLRRPSDPSRGPHGICAIPAQRLFLFPWFAG